MEKSSGNHKKTNKDKIIEQINKNKDKVLIEINKTKDKVIDEFKQNTTTIKKEINNNKKENKKKTSPIIDNKEENIFKDMYNELKKEYTVESFFKGKFSKFLLILLSIFVISMIIAFSNNQIVSGIVAILQSGMVVVSSLICLQIIKKDKFIFKILPIIVAILFIIPFFSSYNTDEYRPQKFDWSEIEMNELLPKPKSNVGSIYSNYDDYLNVYIYKTSKKDYNNYLENCKDYGFTIDNETSLNSYVAYNSDGYKLSLDYSNEEKYIEITLNSPLKMSNIDWSSSNIAKQLPIPKSLIGKIEQDNDKGYKVYIDDITNDDFNSYITECEEKGFINKVKKTSNTYYAENENGYRLTLEYKGFNAMYISILEPEYEVEVEIEITENLIFSKYNVDVYIDDIFKGTINHGEKETYKIKLIKGKHKIRVENEEDDEVDGTISFNVEKSEKLQFSIYCTSSNVQIEQIKEEEKNEDNSNKIENSSDNEKEEISTDNSLENTLENTFPREYAKRAVVVAMTNGSATDVFKSDGNTYDTSKFHKYSDMGDYYLSIYSNGSWNAKDSKTWHVENMKLEVEAFNIDHMIKITTDITYDGNNYILSNVHTVRSAPKYIDSNDPNKINIEDLEPRDSTPYLTVSNNLIKDDRSGTTNKVELDEAALTVAAKNTFEKYGKSKYPYGFKCHWIMNFIACEVRDDGSVYLKVGVTIENQYGNKIEGIASGIVNGSTVKDFYVSY